MLKQQQPALILSITRRCWELPLLWGAMYRATAETLAYRGLIMLNAGFKPNARDRREYRRMVQEKAEAAVETSFGIGADLVALAADLGRLMWTPVVWDANLWRMYSDGLGRSTGQGLAMVDGLGDATMRSFQPWRQRVEANAKRLRRRRA